MDKTEKFELTQPSSTKDHSPDLDVVELQNTFESLSGSNRFDWQTNLHLKSHIGRGGQSVIRLAERNGADGFKLLVAAKFFSPEFYGDVLHYDADMRRVAEVAAAVARVRHENLIDVHHFLNRDRIRIMITEWIQGFDFRKLMTHTMFGAIKDRVSAKRWEAICSAVVRPGMNQPKLTSDAAYLVILDCLSALKGLHCEGVIHGDVKPSNIMLDVNGCAKLIDIGSSVIHGGLPRSIQITPAYAAPSTLEQEMLTEVSDLVSLGFVAVEWVTGRSLFSKSNSYQELLDIKYQLIDDFELVTKSDLREDHPLFEMIFNIMKIAREYHNREYTVGLAVDRVLNASTAVGFEKSRMMMASWIQELLEFFSRGVGNEAVI